MLPSPTGRGFSGYARPNGPRSRLTGLSGPQNVERRKQKIFISYSHKDNAWCKPFSEALKVQVLDVFFDDGSIGTGADWVSEIGKHIDECDLFIVVLTPDAWASKWVQRELNTAFAARKDLVPMLLKDTTVTGFLRAVQWVDVRVASPSEAAELVKKSLA